MKTLLIETLEKLGYPVHLQGTLAADEPYPDDFITFLVSDAPANSHYDNAAKSWAWAFSVIFYSNNPLNVATVPAEIRKKLKAAGFILDGKGRDMPSDKDTHTGWVQTVRFIEREE